MSTRPKTPGDPVQPLWRRVLLSAGAILFFSAVASGPVYGLYQLNVRIGEAVTEWSAR